MTTFSRASAVPLGTIAHYCRPGDKGRYPSATQLERITLAMPKPAQPGLIMAFISDLVPPKIAKNYEVVAKNREAGACTIEESPHLPKSTQKALEALAGLAASNLTVRRMLESTAKAMIGE